ncbi:MAG: NusG domain II-containing protein [Clostridioides sp.]|nr:NusG domain II-containing protein [Clostridioides sp.]
MLKKRDRWLILAIIVAIAVFFAINASENTKKTAKIEVYVDNKIYKSIPVGKNEEFKVETKAGYNVVRVHDGGVEIVDASCPDKVCVHTGFINKQSQNIVCLPNKVSIVLTGTEADENSDDDIDILSR